MMEQRFRKCRCVVYGSQLTQTAHRCLQRTKLVFEIRNQFQPALCQPGCGLAVWRHDYGRYHCGRARYAPFTWLNKLGCRATANEITARFTYVSKRFTHAKSLAMPSLCRVFFSNHNRRREFVFLSIVRFDKRAFWPTETRRVLSVSGHPDRITEIVRSSTTRYTTEK